MSNTNRASRRMLDEIYASSRAETAAVLLNHAPNYVRALKQIRMVDLSQSDRRLWADKPGWEHLSRPDDDIVLRYGRTAQLHKSDEDWIRVGGHLYPLLPGSIREGSSPHGRDLHFAELLTGDEYLERLLILGQWTCPDGTVVIFDRENGLRTQSGATP